MSPDSENGAVFVVRDNKDIVIRSFFLLEHAKALCKGRKGWSITTVPNALTEKAIEAIARYKEQKL